MKDTVEVMIIWNNIKNKLYKKNNRKCSHELLFYDVGQKLRRAKMNEVDVNCYHGSVQHRRRLTQLPAVYQLIAGDKGARIEYLEEKELETLCD